jgi:hypothetical protein
LGPPFGIEDSVALKIALVISFVDVERANLFNIYFSKQSEIDDSNSNNPNLSHATNQISEIKLCENEVEDILKVIIIVNMFIYTTLHTF